MIATSERTEYGFAVGRVRAQETTLLDRPRYDRLVRAPDLASLRAALADAFYGKFLSDSARLEDVFARAASESFDFLARYCLDAWVLDIFRLRADIHNLKLLFRIRAGAPRPAAGLLVFGTTPLPRLESLVLSDAARSVGNDDALAEVVRELISRPALEPDSVDMRLDRLEQDMVLARVRRSEYLSGWRAAYADVENLRTLLRVRAAGLPPAALEQAFLAGGTIPFRPLRELVAAEQDALAARFRMTRLRRLFEEGAAEVFTAESFLRFERLGREFVLSHVRLARYATFGYEPLVAFFLMRENEIGNLRRLAAAKAAGVDETACREMVAYAD